MPPTVIIEDEDVKVKFEMAADDGTWNFYTWHDDHWLAIPLKARMANKDVLWSCALIILDGRLPDDR
jgi:hypothetical protein